MVLTQCIPCRRGFASWNTPICEEACLAAARTTKSGSVARRKPSDGVQTTNTTNTKYTDGPGQISTTECAPGIRPPRGIFAQDAWTDCGKKELFSTLIRLLIETGTATRNTLSFRGSLRRGPARRRSSSVRKFRRRALHDWHHFSAPGKPQDDGYWSAVVMGCTEDARMAETSADVRVL